MKFLNGSCLLFLSVAALYADLVKEMEDVVHGQSLFFLARFVQNDVPFIHHQNTA